MSERFFDFLYRHSPSLEAGLNEWLPLSRHRGAERLNSALRYAVFPGGKRWRPMLALIAAKLAGAGSQEAMPVACAIEYLHTSSLILDDLPAMDDADLRRGRATLHLVFGEGVALLAALALLNQSYALFARGARARGAAERLVSEATRCVGADGMIGGQAADLEIADAANVSDTLACRMLKTTGLLRLTMTASAVAFGASEEAIFALSRYGECLGAAYQIYDDLLDESGESDVTGKPAGQDARHLRASFVAELGAERARRVAASLIEEAKAMAEKFPEKPDALLLVEATDFITRASGRVERPSARAQTAKAGL